MACRLDRATAAAPGVPAVEVAVMAPVTRIELMQNWLEELRVRAPLK